MMNKAAMRDESRSMEFDEGELPRQSVAFNSRLNSPGNKFGKYEDEPDVARSFDLSSEFRNLQPPPQGVVVQARLGSA